MTFSDNDLDAPPALSVPSPIAAFSDADLDGAAPPESQDNGFLSRVGNDLSKRGDNWNQISSDYQEGTHGLPFSVVKGMGKVVAGSVGDVIGEGTDSALEGIKKVSGDIARISPEVRGKIQEDYGRPAVNYIAGTDAGKAGIEAAKQGIEAYQAFKKEHPDAADMLESSGYIASLIPTIKGIGEAGEIAAPGIKRILADETSGSDLSGMKEFLKSNSGDASNPNAYTPPSTSSAARDYREVKKSNQSIADGTGQIYGMAHDVGMGFSPEGNKFAINKIQEDVGKLYDKLHRQTSGAMAYFLDEAGENGLNLKTLDDAKKTFGRIAYDSSADANDVHVAKRAMKSIDEILDAAQENPAFLENGAPEAADILRYGRASSSLEQRHNTVYGIVRNANGDANKIQAQMRKIFEDEDEFSRFSQENQKIIEAIAHPGKLSGALEQVGRLGIGNGPNSAIQGELLGTLLGHPGAATAAFGVGTAANMTRNQLIKRATETILKNIEKDASRIRSSAEITHGNYIDELQAAQEASAAAANTPKPTLSLPSAEPRRPMVGGRGKEPRLATDEEWQNIIEQEKADKASGMGEARKAQQKKAVSTYERENPENNFFNEVGDKPIKSSQTALDTKSIGKKNPFHKGDGLPDEDGNFARGGAVKHVNTEPTAAQKMAGNYKKAHVKLHGLDISIENPKGSVRKGKGKDGKEWQSTMPDHYGYIKRTQGADDDHIDVYLGENKHSNRVYVIDQKDSETGKFDEHKVMLCYGDRDDAVRAYRSAFSDKKDRIMKVTRLSVSEFKDWLKNGNTRQPLRKVA